MLSAGIRLIGSGRTSLIGSVSRLMPYRSFMRASAARTCRIAPRAGLSELLVLFEPGRRYRHVAERLVMRDRGESPRVHHRDVFLRQADHVLGPQVCACHGVATVLDFHTLVREIRKRIDDALVVKVIGF